MSLSACTCAWVHTYTHTHNTYYVWEYVFFLVRRFIASIRIETFSKSCHLHKVKSCYSSLSFSHFIKFMKIQVIVCMMNGITLIKSKYFTHMVR